MSASDKGRPTGPCRSFKVTDPGVGFIAQRNLTVATRIALAQGVDELVDVAEVHAPSFAGLRAFDGSVASNHLVEVVELPRAVSTGALVVVELLIESRRFFALGLLVGLEAVVASPQGLLALLVDGAAVLFEGASAR